MLRAAPVMASHGEPDGRRGFEGGAPIADVSARVAQLPSMPCVIPFPGRWKGRLERAREASLCIPEPYTFERMLDEDGTETLAFGWRNRGAAPFLPREHQAVVTHWFPSDADAAGPI